MADEYVDTLNPILPTHMHVETWLHEQYVSHLYQYRNCRTGC